MFVAVSIDQSQWDQIPAELPRHPSAGAAREHAPNEGWTLEHNAVIVRVDQAGRNLGVVDA